MKSNLEHSALPDPDEIRKYQSGELDAARAHEIELIAQENPLLAEAIEGFASNPAYHLLPGITAAVTTAGGIATTSSITAGTVAGAVKVASPWWHLNGWLIGATVGTSAAVGTYYIADSVSKDSQKITEIIATHPNEHSEINQVSELNYADLADSSNVSVVSGKTNVEVNVDGAAQGVQHHDASTHALIQEDQNTARNQTLPEKINTKKSQEGVSATGDKNEGLPKSSSTVAIQIMKVLNYKMADYTSIRENAWEKFDESDIGLPARWKSEQERESYLREHPESFVPYVDYVTTCISAYDQEKFEMAIQRFAVILDQYPDDVNALFYSAMSEYNLKRYDRAIQLFSLVEKNMIRTFNEEAFFYHARCLKALGDVDGANSNFVKVIQMNGFYRERAIEEMQ
jgi:TolA-binding protein